MRQKHFALAEQVANDAHAVHQRPFDHVDRAATSRLYFQPRFFRIRDDVLGDTANQRMRESRAYRFASPRQVFNLLFLLAFETIRKLHQSLGGIIAPIEKHILDAFEQLLGNVVIHT